MLMWKGQRSNHHISKFQPNPSWAKNGQTVTRPLSDTHCRCKELLKQNGFSVSQSLVLCLRNAFDITIRQTIKRYYRLQQLETDGMMYYSSHQSSIYWNNSSMHWNEILNLLRCKVERVLEAVSGFTNPFSSSFEDNEPVLFVFLCSY